MNISRASSRAVVPSPRGRQLLEMTRLKRTPDDRGSFDADTKPAANASNDPARGA